MGRWSLMGTAPIKRVYFDTNILYRWPHPGNDVHSLLSAMRFIAAEGYVPSVVEDELEAPVMDWASRVVAHEMRDKDSAEGIGLRIPEPSVTIYQILTMALGMGEPGAVSSRMRELGPRVGLILRKHGWRRHRRGPRGSRQYQYYPPIGWDWQAALAEGTEK